MSRSCQRENDIRIRTFAVTCSTRSIIPPQSDGWDQLIYASRGVMSVYTESGAWVVPSHRAVWVPAGIRSSIEISGMVSLRALYITAGLAKSLPRATCRIVNVSSLLRELILHATRLAPLYRSVPEHRHLIQVILDQLKQVSATPLQIRTPSDPRAARVAAMLREHPSDSRRIAAIAREAGASSRTIERLFRAETGMAFGQWRQRLRVLHSLTMLARGDSVSSVAVEMGYQSASAFISMFKQELGTTPGAYFAI
jgi:AraC-like DNA-binding protein